MGVSTAGILSRPVYLARIFWDVLLPLLTILTWIMGFMAFQGLLLLEYVVVLKRTEMCVFVVGLYARSPPDSSCQLDVFRHDGNSPGVDGTQVSVIEQLDKVCLRRLLETHYRC